MPVVFRECSLPPLKPLSVSAPDGYVIGLVGDSGCGASEVLQLAAGKLDPHSGTVTVSDERQYAGPADELAIGDARTLSIDHTLALKDAAARARAAMDLELFRRRGGVGLLASHELDMVQWLADEVWWFHEGVLMAKGDPRETLDRYRRHVSSQLRARASGHTLALTPTMRGGDGRATLLMVETLDENLRPTSVWQTGANVAVRVTVRFAAAVDHPVIGMLIRTRIGFEVFGTNTGLERVEVGPRQAGETLQILFRFACMLCPHEYTLTIASHDPDGIWHDWVEDGVAFSVTDHRYTAGVACLRASVEFQLVQS